MDKQNQTIIKLQLLVSPLYKVLYPLMSRVRATEDEIPGPVLVVANHISMLDPFMIIASFSGSEFKKITPIRTIMNNRLLYGHPFTPLLRRIGCFPVRPHKNHPSGLKASVMYAKHSSLLYFPEGGIRGGKNSTRLRTGASVIADEAKIDVLPILIKKVGIRYIIVRGKTFKSRGIGIHKMMDKVWDLEKHIP